MIILISILLGTLERFDYTVNKGNIKKFLRALESQQLEYDEAAANQVTEQMKKLSNEIKLEEEQRALKLREEETDNELQR